jgi:hypothetical protein
VKHTRRQTAGLSHGADDDASPPLPLLPVTLLRRHSCADPNDTRFRSVARLRQSLWREQHGCPCGRYVDGTGHSRRLGSMVSTRIGRQGINRRPGTGPPRPV